MFCFNSDTSDVQAVTAIVVGESTVDIQCLFTEGSDAIGCKVTLVSECTGVDYHHHTNILRANTTAFGQLQLSLTYSSPCYHKVFAYDIEADNTTSTLAVKGIIMKRLIENTESGICYHS